MVLAIIDISFWSSRGFAFPVDIIDPSFRIITFAAIFVLIQAG
jgi:hypothetical protein